MHPLTVEESRDVSELSNTILNIVRYAVYIKYTMNVLFLVLPTLGLDHRIYSVRLRVNFMQICYKKEYD